MSLCALDVQVRTWHLSVLVNIVKVPRAFFSSSAGPLRQALLAKDRRELTVDNTA